MDHPEESGLSANTLQRSSVQLVVKDTLPNWNEVTLYGSSNPNACPESFCFQAQIYQISFWRLIKLFLFIHDFKLGGSVTMAVDGFWAKSDEFQSLKFRLLNMKSCLRTYFSGLEKLIKICTNRKIV